MAMKQAELPRFFLKYRSIILRQPAAFRQPVAVVGEKYLLILDQMPLPPRAVRRYCARFPVSTSVTRQSGGLVAEDLNVLLAVIGDDAVAVRRSGR